MDRECRTRGHDMSPIVASLQSCGLKLPKGESLHAKFFIALEGCVGAGNGV